MRCFAQYITVKSHFQLSVIDMAELHKHVSTTLDALNQLMTIDGEFMNRLNHDFSLSLASFEVSSRAIHPKQHFQSSIQKPFSHHPLIT